MAVNLWIKIKEWATETTFSNTLFELLIEKLGNTISACDKIP